MDPLLDACRDAARMLRGHKAITVFGHRDADGICSSLLLEFGMADASVDITIIRHGMDISSLPDIANGRFPVFVDYGSSEIPAISEAFSSFLILDHHPTVQSHRWMVNPWDFGIDGTREMCGSSLVYHVVRELSRDNMRLSPIALVGAMGDKQYLSGFSGPNAGILDDAVSMGLARTGRRPIDLEVSFGPCGEGFSSAKLCADVIDACASMNAPDTALDMMRRVPGGRNAALSIYADYMGKYDSQYNEIVGARERILSENSQHLAYFIHCDSLEPGFSGVLAEELREVFPDKPVVVISRAPYGYKASGRATDRQLEDGVHLGKAMGEGSAHAGGKGGGHDVAAGATIPGGALEDFKASVTLAIFRQISSPFKYLFEVATSDVATALGLAQSIAVDNGTFKSTSSMSISRGSVLYLLILSDNLGSFRNTVDDALVCISSAKGVISVTSGTGGI